MAGPRRVEPEWLDELPADDARAIRSRRDLRRVNLWMGQAGIMRRLLLAHWHRQSPRSILELGAGDGTFMLRLARRLAPRWPGVELTLLDRRRIVDDRTEDGFASLGWRLNISTGDVHDLLVDDRGPRADIVMANLFLHHFPEAQLARLLARIAARASLLVACEPRRSAIALSGSRLLWAIGCSEVSRHDATASVRAGFRGDELSDLWPDRSGWIIEERRAGLFSHAFAARRRDQNPEGHADA